MLKLNLSPIFKARGIRKPYTFLRNHGFTHNIAHKLMSGTSRECRYDHIERLCRAVLCTPNDLFLWIPDKDVVYPDNLPLNGLKNKPEGVDIQKELSTMTLEEIREFNKRVFSSEE